MEPIQTIIRLLSGSAYEAGGPQWYYLRLTSVQVKAREQEAVIAQFHIDYVAANRPRGMALWLARNKGGSATVFFSPQSVLWCQALIADYRIRPCAAPMRPMVLIAGDYACSPAQPSGWAGGAVNAPLARYLQASRENDFPQAPASFRSMENPP